MILYDFKLYENCSLPKSESVKITDLKEEAKKMEGFNVDDILQISKEAEDKYKNSIKNSQKADETNPINFELSEKDKEKIRLIEKFIEITMGKKIKILTMDELDKEDKGKINFDNLKNKIKNINMTRNHNKMENAQPGMNMEYTYSEKYYESQKLSFSAEGAVKTKDGREINFQLDLKLSRSYYRELCKTKYGRRIGRSL